MPAIIHRWQITKTFKTDLYAKIYRVDFGAFFPGLLTSFFPELIQTENLKKFFFESIKLGLVKADILKPQVYSDFNKKKLDSSPISSRNQFHCNYPLDSEACRSHILLWLHILIGNVLSMIIPGMFGTFEILLFKFQ